jgi:RNA recognition motif-containing protein
MDPPAFASSGTQRHAAESQPGAMAAVRRFRTKETRMNIYVGNLAYRTDEDELRAAFEPFGAVASVHIIKDRETGQSKGFGFVEMGSTAEGQAAIEALNGKELNGRKLNVNEARPKAEGGRGGRGFSGGPGEGRGGGRRP